MRQHFSPQPPATLRAAFEADKAHALSRHRRGVERIAELMTVPPHVLYKWLETGRMPAACLPGWEHATGGTAVIQYLAGQGHRLLIEIPHGRPVVANDVAGLQRITHDAIGSLLAFSEGKASADQTMGALLAAMGALAYHRENVRKAAAPELDLED